MSNKSFILSIIILLTLFSSVINSDNLKVIKPKLGQAFDISDVRFQNLKKENRFSDGYYSEDDFYRTIGENDDSWYNLGGPYKITASSCLQSTSKISYKAENIHDFDLRTVWAVGSWGNGQFPYVEYFFKFNTPPVNAVHIVNGYIKNNSSWKDNNRVKTLKVYVNNKPYAILQLEDTKTMQIFQLDKEFQSKIKGEDLVLKFEILDVYKGQKYDDTVITELEFDGTGVLCLAKGTPITLSDGSNKAIELLKINDKILSFNFRNKKVESAKVLQLADLEHHNFVKLSFNNLQITVTDDHPIFVKNKGWCSLKPENSKIYKNIKEPKLLEIGDKCQVLLKDNKLSAVVLTKVEKINASKKAYTIINLDKNDAFFANGLLVGVENIK